jgi:dihydroxyacid dehydratase/phosphogluconate dehydratase
MKGRHTMARTPLLRSLTRLAADHAEAAEQGIPVEAVREGRARARERRASTLSRREFLAGAAAAGAAGAFATAAVLPRSCLYTHLRAHETRSNLV